MKGNNIILVGLMGAGKSTIGKYLNNIIPDYNFVDTDFLIEKKIKMSISDFFSQKSEKEFRKIETEIIKDTTINNNLIISTGGGAFELEENRNVLLKSGKVFYLYAPSELLYDRIKTQSDRPLLQCENPLKKLKELLNIRDINYRKADYIIDTSSKDIKIITKEILRRVNETVDIS